MTSNKLGDRFKLYFYLSQQTEEELRDRINSLKDFSTDVDLKTIIDLDELALNLVGSWQQKSGELLK